MPASYYPIQILLAFIGIVAGIASWSLLESLGYKIIGKPDLWLWLIPGGLAILLVRAHRAYILRRMGTLSRNQDEHE